MVHYFYRILLKERTKNLKLKKLEAGKA